MHVRAGYPQRQRQEDRYGDPAAAFRHEVVPAPEIGPEEVLVAVMAAGINYNNAWAARGYPVDQIAVRQKAGETEDFHRTGERGMPSHGQNTPLP